MFVFLWILLLTCIRAQQPCFEHLTSTNLLGAYRPQCNDRGLYHLKQCHGSTGHCWCVTSHGVRQGESVPPGRRLSCLLSPSIPTRQTRGK